MSKTWQDLSFAAGVEYELWKQHPKTYEWRKRGIGAVWVYVKRGLNRIKQIRWSTRHAWQRVFRGWDDTAVWNLDSYLTQHLGEQLLEMGRTTHHVWPDPEEVTPHANALLAYSRSWERPYEEVEALEQGAREALEWVAANLSRLWT